MALLSGIDWQPALRKVELLGERRLREPWSKSRELVAAIEGTARVGGRDHRVRVGLCRRFPTRLPHVFLSDMTASTILPHIEPRRGWVCYESPEGLSISLRDHGQVVVQAVEQALDVLDDSLAGRNRGDVAHEMEAHWASFARAAVPSYVHPDGSARRIAIGYHNRQISYVADTHEQPMEVDPRARRSAGPRWGLYIPLPQSEHPLVVDPRSLRNAQTIRQLVDAKLTQISRDRVDWLLGRRLFPFVVLGFPRPDGTRSLVGIQFPSTQRRARLKLEAGARPGWLVSLQRRDAKALRGRGGAQVRLGSSRVALFGCGSVGGHVATSLARAGVGRLDLVDPELLEFENLFRHALGARHVGHPKAAALAGMLQGDIPYCEAIGVRRDALSAIERGEIDLEGLDLAIVAIGASTDHRLLNSLLHARGVPAVHTWLEPLGIGGHGMLVWSDSAPGCFECLFCDEERERLAPRSDFAREGQRFARDVTGCASSFTPYGDLDARTTATVATRLALDALAGRLTASRLRSWKGDATTFEDAGYSLSPRHELEGRQLDIAASDIAQRGCPVCGAEG